MKSCPSSRNLIPEILSYNVLCPSHSWMHYVEMENLLPLPFDHFDSKCSFISSNYVPVLWTKRMIRCLIACCLRDADHVIWSLVALMEDLAVLIWSLWFQVDLLMKVDHPYCHYLLGAKLSTDGEGPLLLTEVCLSCFFRLLSCNCTYSIESQSGFFCRQDQSIYRQEIKSGCVTFRCAGRKISPMCNGFAFMRYAGIEIEGPIDRCLVSFRSARRDLFSIFMQKGKRDSMPRQHCGSGRNVRWVSNIWTAWDTCTEMSSHWWVHLRNLKMYDSFHVAHFLFFTVQRQARILFGNYSH